MHCPACGRTLAEDARFCGYCGAFATADVPPAPQPQPLIEYWVCNGCHVENAVGDAFCVSCGTARPTPAGRPDLSSTPAPAGLPSNASPPAPGAMSIDHPGAQRSGPATPAPTARSRPLQWIVAAAAVIAVAAAVLAFVVLPRDGDKGPAATQTAATEPAPTGAAARTTSPTPSVTASSKAIPATWPGISTRPDAPFWGAFYCAGSNRSKAIQAAQVGHDAGWPTLVLWTGVYESIRKSGKQLWVICAGPYGSRAAAQQAVDRMDADARELGAVRPDLEIHFSQAYVRLVE